MSIAQNFAEIKYLIEKSARRVGRNPAKIRILGASKRMSSEKIMEAINAGLDLIGENRIQEAVDKFPNLSVIEKHFIGKLQSNKVKKVVELFDCIESVDSIKLASLISKHASAMDKTMRIFLEVNLEHEESKTGFFQENVESAYEEIKKLPSIIVEGLMCIPPYEPEPEVMRPYFRTMRMLKNHLGIDKLSMGMSNDFEIAVEEGSDIVRIGTALFGKRL